MIPDLAKCNHKKAIINLSLYYFYRYFSPAKRNRALPPTLKQDEKYDQIPSP